MGRRWKGIKVEAEGEGISSSLSKQVNLLGTLVGHAVSKQAGQDLFELVESLRERCKSAYQPGNEDEREKAHKIITELELKQIDWLLRAYTAFFHMVNKAEQHEIIHINRKRELQADADNPRADSIAEAVYQLKKAGLTYEQVMDVIAKLDIQPTLTAHPTEARRRTVLHIQNRISQSLEVIGSGNCTRAEEEFHIGRLYRQIKLMLNTDDVRSNKLTIKDEVKNGLYFFSNTIWNTLPRIYRDLQLALETYYGKSPELPAFLRYRSWIGGDRDGNPNVTHEVTRFTLQAHRNTVVELYKKALVELRRELSISARQVEIPVRLYRAIEQDSGIVEISAELKSTYKHEPYRERISQIIAKLDRAFPSDDRQMMKPQKSDEDNFLYTVDEFMHDLNVLRQSLLEQQFEELADYGTLSELIMQVKTFGLSLASLDVRQHSSIFEHSVDELLRHAGVCANYTGLDEEKKIELLSNELKNPRPLARFNAELTDTTRETVDLFHTIRKTTRVDDQAIGSVIISMTHSVSDMLEVLILAKETGLWLLDRGKVTTKMDVVPLFETIEDLHNSHALMARLFENPVYRLHLEARGRFQEIMLGYSDSNKDGGYWMANWALHLGQENLSRTCRNYNVDFRLFHGRGGSVGRGGGRANQAMLALPPVCHSGRVRFTEQGEVISFRYAQTNVAHRHIEQIVNAMLRATASGMGFHDESRDEHAKTRDEIMGRIADESMKAYHNLIHGEDFWPWYTGVTPIEHISRLPIASRPVSRKTGSEVDFGSLRAIPWVFAWTQIRHNIPGWYGVGSGINAVIAKKGRLEKLQEMYREWPFFKVVIDNAQREMARSHFVTAKNYNQLSDINTVPEKITAEFERSRDAILKVTGQKNLLDINPVIQKSIKLRNPYTDVLNMIQADLMVRWRDHTPDGEDRLRHLLFISINGLAAAMQSTG